MVDEGAKLADLPEGERRSAAPAWLRGRVEQGESLPEVSVAVADVTEVALVANFVVMDLPNVLFTELIAMLGWERMI
jgi:hypothetical protein